jgi:hypothetical protein
LHLSQVADKINQLQYGKSNSAIDIRKTIVDILYSNTIGQDIRGITFNDRLQPKWDDVSFGVMDSPPIVTAD